MRWISERIARALELVPAPHAPRPERAAFLEEVDRLAQEVATRPGVDGALIAYEGLLVASSRDGLDASAAVVQLLREGASRATRELVLGELQQTVVVGSERKIAIIALGPFSLGVLAASRVDLATALA